MTARRLSLLTGAIALAGCLGAIPALAGPGRPTSASNRRAAARDAEQLLRRVVLPPGARPERSGDHWGLGSGSLAGPAGVKMVDRHAWWKVDRPFQHVLRYVIDHPPQGGRQQMTGSGGPGPSWESVTFQFPARPGVLGLRWLTVTMIQLRSRSTGVRVNGQVQWIIPRAASERVPSGVHVIRVVQGLPGQPSSFSHTVTGSAKVREIIRLINRLPVLQPGVWNCPAYTGNGSLDTFTFRRASDGSVLARAIVAANVGSSNTGCDAMAFWIRGQRQTPLVRARHFLKAVGRLIGVQLTESSRG